MFWGLPREGPDVPGAQRIVMLGRVHLEGFHSLYVWAGPTLLERKAQQSGDVTEYGE